MKNLSCKDSCKKTRQLKESTHCDEAYEVIDGKILYGCEKSLSSSTREDFNFHTCDFWDLKIKEACGTCLLSCGENKNPVIQKTKKSADIVTSMLTSLGPILSMSGIDPASIKKAHDVMNTDNINTNNSAEIESTIKLTNYAKNTLNSIMAGKTIDIAEFKKIKEFIENKYTKK